MTISNKFTITASNTARVHLGMHNVLSLHLFSGVDLMLNIWARLFKTNDVVS